MHDDPILRPRPYPAIHDERPWISRHWLAVVLAIIALWSLFSLIQTDPELGRALDSNSVAEECGVPANC